GQSVGEVDVLQAAEMDLTVGQVVGEDHHVVVLPEVREVVKQCHDVVLDWQLVVVLVVHKVSAPHRDRDDGPGEQPVRGFSANMLDKLRFKSHIFSYLLTGIFPVLPRLQPTEDGYVF